jgi:hypothetical protein
MADLSPIAGKLAKAIRLLSSDKPGEVLAAADSICRILKGAGADIHTLADRVEHANGAKLSEAEMRKLYNAGFEAGRRAAENGPVFRNVNLDDDPSWSEIARECAAHPNRMRSEREKEFVADMVRRLVHGGEPTPKQADWLRKIFARVRR